MTDLHLELKHIQKSYLRPVLTDINLEVTNDSYVTIVGKSGSGKSTLLNILGLVEGYDGGEYWFNGQLIRNGIDYARLRLKNIGFIFQSYNLIPTLSCKENILLPTLYNRHNQEQSFDELVELLNLGPLLSQRVTTLSGGEKQRVAIARSLILDPCLILADEPTGNLDPQMSFEIMSLLQEINNLGTTMLVVTHAKDLVERFNKRTIVINDGLIVSDGMEGYHL